MTWLQLANFLFDQSQALSPSGAHLHLDTASWFRTWTPHQNLLADAAVRHFAHSRNWPAAEPETACQLYFRCLFAIERCFQLHAQRPKGPQSAGAEQEALEELLIKAWHLSGIEWAEQRYACSRPPGSKPMSYSAL
jgi:hypothetical protein